MHSQKTLRLCRQLPCFWDCFSQNEFEVGKYLWVNWLYKVNISLFDRFQIHLSCCDWRLNRIVKLVVIQAPSFLSLMQDVVPRGSCWFKLEKDSPKAKGKNIHLTQDFAFRILTNSSRDLGLLVKLEVRSTILKVERLFCRLALRVSVSRLWSTVKGNNLVKRIYS